MNKIIKLIVVGLLTLMLIGNIDASSKSNSGNLTYPNVGWVSIIATDYGNYLSDWYYTGDNTVRFIGYRTGIGTATVTPSMRWMHPDTGKGWTSYSGGTVWAVNNTEYVSYRIQVMASRGSSAYPVYVTCYFMPANIYPNTISGTTECLTYTRLQAKDNTGTYVTIMEDTDASYSFDIMNGTDYKLLFSDSNTYSFTCNGTDITYDHDACSHTQYRFEEACGNLIPNSEGYFLEWNPLGWWNMETYFEESNGILSISNSSATKISIYTNTFIGSTGWLIDPVVPNSTYILENPNIDWGLKVIVQNESDGSLINDAMVRVNQSCYCTSGYSTRQKFTVNGMSQFSDMSLQDASLFVRKTGYKILNENSTGYNVFLSGRSNFSSKTWIVKLAPSSSNNTSEWYETGNKVDIHFRDVNGNRTSQILDTDSEVYLYYENNNSENEAMTLKFQSSSTHTYFIDEDSWSIPHDSIGHKTILNVKFTPYTYAYRAVIYNSSIYGWNMTIPLTVRNATKEDNQHYQNLTTNLWFMYASDGKIDSREDMRIVSHARSNNTTLMNIDLEVYKNGTLLCYKNLTVTDYAGASYPYYYLYEPSYSYVSGANYTIKMYGFDRTLLQVRYVECITDTVTRKNKLTIIVKDNYGHNLNNAYVYLEGYGSLSTGINSYYNSYEGLSNKYYRYKATKTNYEGSGWADVTISDSDEIVTYVLTATGDTNTTSMTPIKMNDDEMKNLYYCLMMFLFIFILFGGLMYLAK